MTQQWALSVRQFRVRFFASLEAVIFALVVALLALIVLQVFTRYVLHAAIPWTEEVARMVLVWTVMIGAAIAMNRNEHYAVTFLSGQFRGTTRLVVMLITNFLGLLFLAALVIYGTAYAASNLATVFVSTQLPRAWIYAALPIGAFIMGLSLLLHSIEACTLGEPEPKATRSGATQLDS